MTEVRVAVQRGVKRLNEKDPQFPPDVYFIKRNERHLRNYIADSSKFHQLLKKASPECKQRFSFFEIKPHDLEKLTGKGKPTRAISPSDPFLAANKFQNYSMLHRSVMSTSQILDHVKPEDSTFLPSKQQILQVNHLESRFQDVSALERSREWLRLEKQKLIDFQPAQRK